MAHPFANFKLEGPTRFLVHHKDKVLGGEQFLEICTYDSATCGVEVDVEGSLHITQEGKGELVVSPRFWEPI